MPSSIITGAALFLLAHAFLADAGYNACEYSELTKCNNVFMSSFKLPVLQQTVGGVYCHGFQVYANCLSASLCFGKFLDLSRFMILQHMIMDKTLNVCPLHNLWSLKNTVQANKKYRKKIDQIIAVDADDYADCAAKIHRDCTSQMAKDLASNDKMCFGVENFLQCYENHKNSCKAKIYKHFLNTVKKVAKTLVKMFKERKGVMPNC
ncbi:uncharacterized protein LOC116304288 [Actinia tenebrosa]|uniref:Uncharacterized protein LOC116304288 n=1 Tax=Actinia tenebrosa TaxID=6105 RepID=A0A6P8IUK5_ACTTE|nr:uncharacterized protein LOC116304288 [Actinia tenebrosa]XP_031569856.1 uncharacterized protein LOC116304288 [Actinia tenebrosa]XP_031569857.1 uncharacterized protein LOC116304288 [Actinia tenebrosa]